MLVVFFLCFNVFISIVPPFFSDAIRRLGEHYRKIVKRFPSAHPESSRMDHRMYIYIVIGIASVSLAYVTLIVPYLL